LSDPVALRPAESPFKADLLKLLDRLRTEVEAGEMLAIAVIPIFASRQFGVRSAGNIGMVELAGYLGRAQLDALNAL
jgi:hypothetical protein